MDRLIRKDKILNKSKLRKIKRKPRKRQKKNQKMNNAKSGVVDRLVKRVLKYDNSKLLDRSESKMNNILKELFVIPSLSMGILGDPSKLNIAGVGINSDVEGRQDISMADIEINRFKEVNYIKLSQ